jgi:hypothetical protein
MAQGPAGHRFLQGHGRVRRQSRRVTAARAGAMGVVVVAVTLLLGSVAFGAAPSRTGAPPPPAAAAATPGTLNGVSCVSSTSCEAVGSFGSSGATQTLAEFWNGVTWMIQPTPNPAGASSSSLDGVFCSSTDTCVAVGGDSDSHGGESPLAETWNGASWTIQSVPLPAGGLGGNLDSVSCSSPTSCAAVGDYADSANTPQPLADRWNGTTFSSETVPLPAGATTSTFGAVACSPSPSDRCEAVGWNFLSGQGEIAMTLAEGWNGKAWSVQVTPIPNDASGGAYPMGVSCSGPKACTSVGEGLNGSGNLGFGWAQTWNGTTWSNRTTHDPTSAIGSLLTGVSCSVPPSHDCTAVGYYTNGSAFVTYGEAFKGAGASDQVTKEPKGSTAGALSGVSCSSPTSCTAVGDVTNAKGITVTLADGSSGHTWSIQKTPNP